MGHAYRSITKLCGFGPQANYTDQATAACQRSITDNENYENTEKGKHLNTFEKHPIYKVNRNRLHINDTHIDVYNPIFEKL
jgi:hypothetical protein